MLGWFVISITSLSIPIPIPLVGGMPYSSDRKKVVIDKHRFVIASFHQF
jgi:hypothetical protein